MDKLIQARKIINEVDEEMAVLFEKRMQAVEDVAMYKKEHDLPIFDEAREQEILASCEKRMHHQEYIDCYKEYMQAVMQVSKKYQKQLLSKHHIAYQGVEGAFSHLATMQLFPLDTYRNYGSFAQVIEAVEQGDAAYGVLPFENSYTGEVGEIMDLLRHHDVFIVKTYDLPIDQNLLGIKGSTLSEITQVYSHQQGLSQCAKYLHGRHLEQIPYPNTALAAKYVSECQDVHKAAIASKATAAYYDLSILEENINTSTNNTTRFIVIQKQPVKTGNRFAMLFTIQHKTGALARVIELIAKYGYNMENIKSRSLKETPWEYYFYIEVVGSLKEEIADVFISELQAYCESFKVVGSYTKLA